jgi:hypothetical protein
MTTFSDKKQGRELKCRWCGKSSLKSRYLWKEESDIIAPTPEGAFVRASELPRGNFAREESDTPFIHHYEVI